MFFSFLFKYLFSPRSGSLIRWVSIIGILGLIGSVASLIVVISVMSGFGISIRDRLLSHQAHLVISEKNSQQEGYEHLFQSVQNAFHSSVLSGDIKSIQPFEKQDLIIKTNSGLFSGALGKGYRKDHLKWMKRERTDLDEQNPQVRWDLEKAHPEEQPFAPSFKNQIYMGSALADQLYILEGDLIVLMPVESLLLPPGEIPLHEEAQLQSLIYFQHSSMHSKDIFYEIGSMPALSDSSSLSYGVEIFLNDPEDYSIYKQFLIEKGFHVESWADRHSSLFFALKIEKFIMSVFLLLASLIASFSISSMMSLLIAQKKKDIGILMVMGWPIKKIRNLFVRISFVMSFIGVTGGLFLGWLICLFIHYNPIDILPPIYHDRSFPVKIDWEVFMGVGLIVCILSYLVSIFPIRSHTLSSCVDLIRKS